MGKSTFVRCCLLADEKHHGSAPRVGDGDGGSCTKETSVYDSCLGSVIVDVPGYDDTELDFEPHDIGSLASFEIAKRGIKHIRVAVFESYAEAANQLLNSVKNIQLAFGKAVLSSVLVIMSKGDMVSNQVRAKKLRKTREIMKRAGIKYGPFEWQGTGLDNRAMQAQLEKLRAFISTVPVVSTVQLEDLETQIKARAQELWKSQKLVEKDHSYTTDQVKIEKREAVEMQDHVVKGVEKYTDTYTDVEMDREEYDSDVPAVESYEMKEMRPVAYETTEKVDESYTAYEDDSDDNGLGYAVGNLLSNVFFGEDKRRRQKQVVQTRKVDKAVIKVKQVEHVTTQQRLVTKTKKKARWVPRRVQKERELVRDTFEIEKRAVKVEKDVPVKTQATKTDKVKVKLPLEKFLPQAREEVIAQARRQYSAGKI